MYRMDESTELGFVSEPLLHASAGVQNGGVVAASEVGGDFRVDGPGEFAHKQHGTLSRHDDVLSPAAFTEPAC